MRGGASSLDGSSSAYPGAGATHQGGSLGGSGTTNGKTNEALSTNLKYDGKAKGVHQSIEDEGVDMGEDHTDSVSRALSSPSLAIMILERANFDACQSLPFCSLDYK